MTSTHPLPGRAQRLIIQYCIGFLFLYIGVEIVELTYGFGRALFATSEHSKRLLLSKEDMVSITPVFFSILISLELVETLRVYLNERSVSIQLILLVGLTAMTRHLLVSDVFHGDPLINFSLASLLVALAGAYFLIEKSGKPAAPCPPR